MFPTLVTDRTQADVAYLKSILSKPMSQWTEEEQAYFFMGRGSFEDLVTLDGSFIYTQTDQLVLYDGDGVVRGAYNHTDLTRVTEAMDYLNGVFKERGYQTAYVPVKTKWSKETAPSVSQMQQYLANVSALRSVVSDGVSLSVPADMKNLTVTEANNIEQILVTVNDLLMRMLLTLVPCGAATSGGDYL